MASLPKPIAVFVGGGLGALIRQAGGNLGQLAGIERFHATMLINVLGSLLIGVAAARLTGGENTPERRALASAFVMTGVLGGFTTFSTFSLEMVELLQSGRFVAAALGIAASVIACAAAAALGLRLARP